MSGIMVLADTNAIHFFQGHPNAIKVLDGNEIFVSAITEIELLSFQDLNEQSRLSIQEFLNDCTIVELVQPIKQRTIALKQAHGIKLPDAVIAAAAQFLKVELLTLGEGFAKIPDLDLILLDF